MRSIFIYLLIVVAVVAIFFTVFSEPFSASREVPISKVIAMATEGGFKGIEVQGDTLEAVTTKDERITSRKEMGSSIIEQLEAAGVNKGAGYVDVSV